MPRLKQPRKMANMPKEPAVMLKKSITVVMTFKRTGVIQVVRRPNVDGSNRGVDSGR